MKQEPFVQRLRRMAEQPEFYKHLSVFWFVGFLVMAGSFWGTGMALKHSYDSLARSCGELKQEKELTSSLLSQLSQKKDPEPLNIELYAASLLSTEDSSLQMDAEVDFLVTVLRMQVGLVKLCRTTLCRDSDSILAGDLHRLLESYLRRVTGDRMDGELSLEALLYLRELLHVKGSMSSYRLPGDRLKLLHDVESLQLPG